MAPMALLEELGTDVQEYATSRGVARFWTLAPNVYVTSVSGHMEEAHAEAFERYGAERLRQSPGKLCVFHDWIGMTGYDSVCRQRMTAWSVPRLSHYAEVHLAVRSKIVAMGVQVANIALRGIMRAHQDRLPLEVELKRVMRTVALAPPLANAAR